MVLNVKILTRFKRILELVRSIKSIFLFVFALGVTSYAFKYFYNAKYYIASDYEVSYSNSSTKTLIYFVQKKDINSNLTYWNQSCAYFPLQTANLLVYLINEWPKLAASVEFFLNLSFVILFYAYSLFKNIKKVDKEFKEINTDPVQSVETNQIQDLKSKQDSIDNVLDQIACIICITESCMNRDKNAMDKKCNIVSKILDFIKGETFLNYMIKILFIPGMYLINAIDYDKTCVTKQINYLIILFILVALIDSIVVLLLIIFFLIRLEKQNKSVTPVNVQPLDAIQNNLTSIIKNKQFNVIELLLIILLVISLLLYIIICISIYIYTFVAEITAKIIGSIFVFEFSSCLIIDLLPLVIKIFV